MATTASGCSRISAAALLALGLAAPAVAQSQSGTGVGGALDEIGGITAEIDALITREWRGETGRWAKGGIGVAGLAAALISAYDAVGPGDGKGTLRFTLDGEGRLRLGAPTATADGVTPVVAPTGTR